MVSSIISPKWLSHFGSSTWFDLKTAFVLFDHFIAQHLTCRQLIRPRLQQLRPRNLLFWWTSTWTTWGRWKAFLCSWRWHLSCCISGTFSDEEPAPSPTDPARPGSALGDEGSSTTTEPLCRCLGASRLQNLIGAQVV